MSQSIGNLTLYMGPDDLGGPDDLERTIVDFIDGARETLAVAVQELESEPIAQALVRARRRRVRVRVVLEGDYLMDYPARTNPFQPSGPLEANRRLLSALWRANVSVRTDYNPKIFHQKFIVRDVDMDGATRAVLTGSTNFTPTGVNENLNHLVVVRGALVARQYGTEFEEIWGGTFGASRVRHEPKPREVGVSRVRVKPLFAPDHAPEMEIMKQMLKARHRIDFAIFTFSESSGIDDCMAALQRAGIQVRGIVDGSMGARPWAGTHLVHAAGAELYLARRRNGLNKLHHKLMVIDGQLVIAGSFNYTEPANLLNDENILVIGDLEETNAQAVARQTSLGAFALAEIDRMITRFCDPVT